MPVRSPPHRELTGHNDAAEALPGPPQQGQIEAYASWYAAWRALGRDEVTREETEMSDGQLRVRVRAYQREQAWAPNYVAPDLSGTLQAARRHRGTAELLTAEADQETDDQHKAQLQREAAESRALADLLDQQANKLERADEIRGLWYAHTAHTRAAGERARLELADRDLDPDAVEDSTTADQLLADQRAGQADDDRHREPTSEPELAEIAQQREADLRAIEPTQPADTTETEPPWVR